MTDKLTAAYHQQCDEIVKLKDDLERVSAERDLAREAATDARVRLEEERTLRLRVEKERAALYAGVAEGLRRGGSVYFPIFIAEALRRAGFDINSPSRCMGCGGSGRVADHACPVCHP